MAAPSRRPLRLDQEERRAILRGHFLNVIEAEMKKGRSYTDISVIELIAAVGVSRSSFYAYYDDKNALLQELTEAITSDLVSAARPWFDFPADGTEADLREALRSLFTAYRAHRHVLRAIVESVHDAGIREKYATLVEAAVVHLQTHISQRQATGGVRPDLHPLRTAQWLTCMHERGLYQFVSNAPSGELDELLDTATQLTWRALYEGTRDAA